MVNVRDRFDSLFTYWGEQSHVPGALLKAQAMAESAMNPTAVSPVGARGLSQFMDATWREWADGTPGTQDLPLENLVYLNPENPDACIRAQAAFMGWLIRHMLGDIDRALAAYNWGFGRMRKLRDDPRWRDHLPDETRTYIARIHEQLGPEKEF